MRQGRRVVAIVALAFAVAAPPAAAQQDEVFVDPDSPTGHEYDIPLERARRDAAGQSGAGAQPYRSRSAPLFGQGVGDEPAAEGTSVAPGTSRPRARPRSSGGDVPEAVQAAVLRPGAPDGGAGSSLPFAGAALLVLLLGAGGGVLLRRMRA